MDYQSQGSKWWVWWHRSEAVGLLFFARSIRGKHARLEVWLMSVHPEWNLRAPPRICVSGIYNTMNYLWGETIFRKWSGRLRLNTDRGTNYKYAGMLPVTGWSEPICFCRSQAESHLLKLRRSLEVIIIWKYSWITGTKKLDCFHL